MAGRHASFSSSSRMYPRQSAEPVDHASRAARRLNAMVISVSLSRVYAGAQSAQWPFPGLGVSRQVDHTPPQFRLVRDTGGIRMERIYDMATRQYGSGCKLRATIAQEKKGQLDQDEGHDGNSSGSYVR